MGRVLWIIALLCVTQVGDAEAGKAKKLHRLMAKDRHADVIRIGNAYLDSDKPREDAAEVRLLIARAAYLMASKDNTTAAYRHFLSRHPRSAYVDRVKEQLAELQYQELLQSPPSLRSHQSFQSLHPTSSHLRDSQRREEELAWKEARQQGSVQAIQSFQKTYPKSPFTRAAKESEAERVYRGVQQDDQLDGYLSFIKAYPASRYTQDARSRSRDLAWSRAKERDDVGTYKEFRNLFGEGADVDAAYQRELELAWANAKQTHKIQTFREFEREYAHHDLANTAEELEWDLYHYQRRLFPGELRPKVTRTVREEDGSYRLFLSVLDQSDRYVGGLSADNFQVYDSGFRATVLSLEGMESNRPLDVVFVLDLSGSMRNEIASVKRGIIRFEQLMQLRSRDMRTGLVTFVEEIFSVNGQALGRNASLTSSSPTFQRWIQDSQLQRGGAEDDFWALDVASKTRMRKKSQRVLILVTDEPPTYTKRFNSADTLGRDLASRDVTVYSITPNHSAYRTISRHTNGELFDISEQPFDDIIERVAQKLSKQYRLRYRRPPEAPPVLDELNVRIRVKRDHAWITKSDASSGGGGTRAVAISPHDSRHVFRAPDTGGLRCSKDGGGRWSSCGQGLPQNEPISQLLFDGDQKEHVWTRTDDGQLWRSTDGGKEFSNASLSSGGATTIMTSPSDAGARLAFDGQTLWRNKAGTEWVKASTWSPEQDVVTMAGREGSGGLMLAVMKNGELMRSEDEGQTFQPVAGVPWSTEDPPSGVVFHPTRDGLAIAYGGDRLYRSLDDGQTWRPVPLKVPSEGNEPVQVQAVAFDPTVRQMHLVTTNHGVLASHDLGRTWAPSAVGIDRGASVGTVAVAPDGRAIMGSSNSNAVYSLEAVANREFVFSKVFFASGATRPKRSLLPHLDDVARTMRRNRSAHMHVEGHADSVGSAKLNDKVSRGRAQYVVDYLAKKGVPRSQMSIAWYGEDRPLFDNDSSRGRSKNRRVEMVLTDGHKKIPSQQGMK